MKITARGLNRSTLGRQMLLRRESLGVLDAMRRLVAVQAQAAPSPYVALWNRIVDFDPTELDTAFADRKVVKATLLRITLHAVHADDYRAFREAMEPTLRAARLDGRFLMSGLTRADADALLPDMLRYLKRTRTAEDMTAWLAQHGAEAEPSRAWWALRAYAPVLHAPTGPPWSFPNRPSYVAANVRPKLDRDTADVALRTLIRRYLAGFGPASIADMAHFCLVQRARAKDAVRAIAGDLDTLTGPDGTQLYDLPGAPRPDDDTPAPPRLLPMWDSVLLSAADRDRVTPPECRPHIARSNGDVLPTLLVDGYVAGVWRPVDDGIEVTAFHRLPDETWAALRTEARSLWELLADREPLVYRRYDRWWHGMPGAEVRML